MLKEGNDKKMFENLPCDKEEYDPQNFLGIVSEVFCTFDHKNITFLLLLYFFFKKKSLKKLLKSPLQKTNSPL